MCGRSRWWRPAAPRKLLLEANRRPPSLVDVSRAVTAGQGGVAVTSGPACASVSCAAVPPTAAAAAPGPCPGDRSGVTLGQRQQSARQTRGDLVAAGGDTHTRWAFEGTAMLRHRRPVHHGIAGSTPPACVTATAMSKADDVSDEDLIRPERVSVGAAGRRVGYPCAVDGTDKLPLVHARDCNPHHRPWTHRLLAVSKLRRLPPSCQNCDIPAHCLRRCLAFA
jgi:hypothetical protein